MDGRNRLLVLLFSALMLAGCGSKEKDKGGPVRWGSFPVALYADSEILNNPANKADLDDAINYWTARAGRQLFNLRGAWAGQYPPYSGDPNRPDSLHGNVIYFERNWPFAQNIAAQTIVVSQRSDLLSSVVMINNDMHLCAGNCAAGGGSSSQRRVFTHELGHFLGLQHNGNAADIMYPEVQPGNSLDNLQFDAAALAQVIR